MQRTNQQIVIGPFANFVLGLQVGSPPSEMTWTPPGHAGTPFSAGKPDQSSQVQPSFMLTPVDKLFDPIAGHILLMQCTSFACNVKLYGTDAYHCL